MFCPAGSVHPRQVDRGYFSINQYSQEIEDNSTAMTRHQKGGMLWAVYEKNSQGGKNEKKSRALALNANKKEASEAGPWCRMQDR